MDNQEEKTSIEVEIPALEKQIKAINSNLVDIKNAINALTKEVHDFKREYKLYKC